MSVGGKYKKCLFCGGRAEIGFEQFGETSAAIKFVTENGSYILPNGVIVLVDEDINAYMNNNKLFLFKNDSNLIVE